MQLRQKWEVTSPKDLFNIGLFILMILLYAPIVLRWYDGWLNKNISTEHEYFSYGLIGLPYAAYLIWKNRHQWATLRTRCHPLGPLLIGLALYLYAAGSPQPVFLSFPIMLIGISLWFKGIPGLRLNWFPLFLIFLATPNPIPYLLAPYTLGLQKFIATVAGLILTHLGINVQVDGIYLLVNERLVEVAPYCAGLKMLFTSLYVALILLHWTGRLGNRSITALILMGAAGISITANILRNTLLTWFHGTGQDANFEILHSGWGGDLYSALMLLVIVGLLKHIEWWQLNWQTNQIDDDEGEYESIEN